MNVVQFKDLCAPVPKAEFANLCVFQRGRFHQICLYSVEISNTFFGIHLSWYFESHNMCRLLDDSNMHCAERSRGEFDLCFRPPQQKNTDSDHAHNFEKKIRRTKFGEIASFSSHIQNQNTTFPSLHSFGSYDEKPMIWPMVVIM